MEQIAKTPYMRNLWYIMKEFAVLPTDPSFRSLSDDQLELMLLSVEQDNKEIERARKGFSVDDDYYDSSFEDEVWNKDVGDWEVLKEGHDPDDIARQIEEATAEEDLKNLYSKFDSLDEYNKFLEEGGQTARQSEVQEYMDRQIKVAQEKAQAIESLKDKKGTKGKVFVDDGDLPEVNEKNKKGSDLDLEAMQRSIELFNKREDDKDDEDDEFTIL